MCVHQRGSVEKAVFGGHRMIYFWMARSGSSKAQQHASEGGYEGAPATFERDMISATNALTRAGGKLD
jgi:hypothetical protein